MTFQDDRWAGWLVSDCGTAPCLIQALEPKLNVSHSPRRKPRMSITRLFLCAEHDIQTLFPLLSWFCFCSESTRTCSPHRAASAVSAYSHNKPLASWNLINLQRYSLSSPQMHLPSIQLISDILYFHFGIISYS